MIRRAWGRTRETMTTPLMKCGHAANGTIYGTDVPCCVVCFGINPGAEEVDHDPPDLSAREAECLYCRRKKPSGGGGLPFFEHRPDRDCDSFYCGCRGWE